MKKQIILFLALLLVSAANLWAQDVTIDNIIYSLSTNEGQHTATVTGYKGNLTEVTIPEKVNDSGTDYTVTEIGKEAFRLSGITSITIPASVNSIGKGAFGICQDLTSVTFEKDSKLKTIGEGAFYPTAITSITIPASVTSIGNDAFCHCSSLKSVTFAEGSQLETIGDNAFASTFIQSITIPKSVNSIGASAFYWVNILIYEGDAGNEKDTWGAKFRNIKSDPNGFIFGNDSQGNPIKLLAYIGDKTEITIPASVITIEEWAFRGSGITSITIPASVTSIGNEAFYYCQSLKTVTFADNSELATIGNGAFLVSGITSITIPASVTSIGDYAFEFCQSLNSVTFADASELATIGDGAFLESGITSITIPASVTSIGDYAFEICRSLKTVTFADDSKFATIGEQAFCESGITSITIPASVTSIGENAFYKCDNLSDVYCHAAPGGITIADNFNDDFNENKGTKFHVKSADKDKWVSKLTDANVTFVGDLIDIADATITISNNNSVYTGNKIEPEIKVSYDKSELILNTDYTISHGNNEYINASEYTITIYGTNLYYGNKKITFAIEKATPTYTTPTFETLPCNTTLTSLSLTKGFAVASNNDELKIGENIIKLSYNPDPENYNTVDNIEVKITLAHKYGTPVYTWSDDGKACTATVTCTVDQTHTVTEKATITNEVTTPATCEAKGTTTYTASFKNTLFTTQTKAVEDIAAPGHKYGTPVYTWSDDGKACTATVTCTVDKTYTVTEKATITNEVTTPATTEAKGVTTYTATFKNTLFTTQTKAVEDIEKLEPEPEPQPQPQPQPEPEPQPQPEPGNPSTPVSSIDNGGNNVKVWSFARTIYIASTPDSQYKIIDLQGRTIATSTTKSSHEQININKEGVYVVIINGKTFKLSL